MQELPEHVRRNRAYWNGLAAEYVADGRRNWGQEEPSWGIFVRSIRPGRGRYGERDGLRRGSRRERIGR